MSLLPLMFKILNDYLLFFVAYRKIPQSTGPMSVLMCFERFRTNADIKQPISFNHHVRKWFFICEKLKLFCIFLFDMIL